MFHLKVLKDFIWPVSMQNKVIRTRWFSHLFLTSCQVYIYAEGDKEYVLAVVVPNLANLENAVMDKHQQKFESYELLCKSIVAEDIVVQDFQKVAKEKGMSAFEVPRSIILESVRWSPNGGTLTPSYKTNRIGLRAKVLCIFASLLYTINFFLI